MGSGSTQEQWFASEPDAFVTSPDLQLASSKPGTSVPGGFQGLVATMFAPDLGPDHFAEATIADLGTAIAGVNTGQTVDVGMFIDQGTGLISSYFFGPRRDGGYSLGWQVRMTPGTGLGAGTDFQRSFFPGHPDRFDLPLGPGHVIRLELQGGFITAKLDGIVVFGPFLATIPAAPFGVTQLTGHRVGMSGYPTISGPANTIKFSNFHAGSLPSGQIFSPNFSDVGNTGPRVLATFVDTLNRPDQNPLGSPWVSCAGGVVGSIGEISNGTYTSSAIGQAGIALYDGGVVWSRNQSVQATLERLIGGSGYAGLVLLGNSTGTAVCDNYVFLLDGVFQNMGTNNQLGGFGHIFRGNRTGGSSYVATCLFPVGIRAKDVFKFQIVGNVLTGFWNGVAVISFTDTDNNYAIPAAGPGYAPLGDKPGLIAIPAFGTSSSDVAWSNFSASSVVLPSSSSAGVLVPIFSDDGLTPKDNPMLTDANGRFDFFVADGRYDIVVSLNGRELARQSNVEILDATEATTADANWETQILGFENQSANPTPPAGFVNLYSKSTDKNLYFKDDTGREVLVAGGGPSTPLNMDAIEYGATYIKYPYNLTGSPFVVNGNFEIPPLAFDTALRSSVAGWEANINSRIDNDHVNAFDGISALKMVSGPFINPPIAQCSPVQAFNVIPGETYNLACAIRTDGIVSSQLMLSFVNTEAAVSPEPPNVAVNPPIATSAVSSTSWTPLAATGTVPAGATMAFLQFRQVTSGVPGTSWLDQVQISKPSGGGPDTDITTLAGLTDVLLTAPVDTQVLTFDAATSKWENKNAPAGGSGTVTSVGLSLPLQYNISGSPVTTAGTLVGQWNPQVPYTVLAAPGNVAVGGVFDGISTNTGNSASSTALLTPGSSHDWAFFVTQAATQSVALPTPSGWSLIVRNGNNGALYNQVLNTNTPITTTVALTPSASWANLAVALALQAGTPAIVQSAQITGAFGASFTAVGFTSSNTAGNAILVFMMGLAPPTATISGVFSDSNGNTYTPLGVSVIPGNQYVIAALATNIIAGAGNQVTYSNIFGGTYTNSEMFAMEVSGLVVANGLPFFRFLQPNDIPAINLALQNSRGGITGSLSPLNLHSGIGASGATFWRGDGIWAAPPAPAIPQAINSVSTKNLSSPVSLSASVDTTLSDLTTVITFPSSGGPWRANASYKLYHSHVNGGLNINAWVSDGSTLFCGSQTGLDADSSLNRENTGSQISPVTYANNATVTFTVHIECSNTPVTVQPSAALAGPGSYFQLSVLSSN